MANLKALQRVAKEDNDADGQMPVYLTSVRSGAPVFYTHIHDLGCLYLTNGKLQELFGLTRLTPCGGAIAIVSLKLLDCREVTLHIPAPQIRSTMSPPSFHPTVFFWTVPFSSGEGPRTGSSCINPALLCVPTEDPAAETTVARVQLPVESQPQLSTYEVSIARCFKIRTNVSQVRLHGTEIGGHATIQRTDPGWQDSGSRNVNCRKVRVVCTNCDRSFGRAQELARHRKDKHERPRNCLFCGFKWTRPSNIKAHLFAKHSENFTAEYLVMIRALRGRMMVAFLDAFN